VQQEGERREIFLRYLGEVASAVGMIKGLTDRGKKDLYGRLVEVARKKTAVADTVMDDRGKKVEEDFGENVLIIAETDHGEETGETTQG
jgi:DNA topoisomerase-6 subunit B